MTCEDKFIQVTWAVVIEWRDKKRKKPGVLIQKKCSDVSTGWSPETSVNRALTWHAAFPPLFFPAFCFKNKNYVKLLWMLLCFYLYTVARMLSDPEAWQII